MAPGKWQNRSMTDLYEDREEEPWYFGASAILTAALVLLGFLVFAQAFSPSSGSTNVLTIVAAVLFALGYSLSVALWFICKSWLFQLHALFIPCFSACVVGTINSGITIGINAQPWTQTMTAAIVLGVISSVLYAGLALAVFRKIQRVRSPSQTTMHTRESSEHLKLLSEEEMQRQNLSRLLGKNEERRIPQATYRIGIPDVAVALRTPPPLSAPLPGLGMAGTLTRGPLSPFNNRNDNQAGSSVTHSPEERFRFPQILSDSGASSERAALEAARERARITQFRARPASPRDEEDSLPYPPVIVNTRNQHINDISDIPLSERHPLERQGHIRGRTSKDSSIEHLYESPAVHRPDEDFGGHDYEEEDAYMDESPTFEIIEGADIRVDLTKGYTRQQPTSNRSAHPTLAPGQHVGVPTLALTPPGRDVYLGNRGSR